MSRKWERTVQRNAQSVNRLRQKQGGKTIPRAGASEEVWFKGRNYFIPFLLVVFAFFLAFVFWGLPGDRTLYWITVGSYLLLALLIFLKRPYLRVGKHFISTRRFAVDKRLEPAEIKMITVMPGYVIIERRSRRMNWVFSRLVNRYDTDSMAARLKEFAQLHSIPYEERKK